MFDDDEVLQTKLLAEWQLAKYDLAVWRQDMPQIIRDDIGYATEWCLINVYVRPSLPKVVRDQRNILYYDVHHTRGPKTSNYGAKSMMTSATLTESIGNARSTTVTQHGKPLSLSGKLQTAPRETALKLK